MTHLSVIWASASFELSRHLRNPALVLAALAAPIAAHFMVPDMDATYAVLTINGRVPILTAPILGLELGALAAVLLTPLAYIFLRAGPSRRRPWQVTDIAPHSRAFWTLGRWVSDTSTLWILLTALTCSGIILGAFRLDDEANIVQTIVALWLPAAPSLALIAAIHLLLDARNLTRGWLGDVVFLFVWVALIVSGITLTTNPETQLMTINPMTDAFGFASPVVGAVDYPVTSVSIGGSNNTGVSVMTDAWRSVTNTSYIKSRFVWLGIAAILALVAGLIWGPMNPKQPNVPRNSEDGATIEAAAIASIPFLPPHTTKSGTTILSAVILSEIRLLFKARVWGFILAATALTGFFLPFRTVSGPAILLCLIFLLTEASGRWQEKTTVQFLDTLGPGRFSRALILWLASTLIASLAMVPALAGMLLQNDMRWLTHFPIICAVMPALIIALGIVTRSAVAGRLLMLIAWYIYLSSAS